MMIKDLIEYKRAYKNWIKVGYYYKIKKARLVTIELRNGEKLTVPKEIVYFIKMLINKQKSCMNFQFDLSSEVFTFPYHGKYIRMKFYSDNKFNGEFAGFLGDYDFLQPLAGNTVIDIGMNIADSAVSFAIDNASLVIGLEPYKYSYEMALTNIEINNLKGKIIPLHAGYGRDGTIEVEDKVSDVGTVLEEHKGGIKIPLFSLSKLLEEYRNNISGELLLKMDCEGCEYNILEENKETLRQFKRILIEYHNGYERLKKYLEECGFMCSFTEPHKWYDETTKRNLIQGYLYARLSEK